MSSHLRAFILSNSKRIKKNFIREKNGLYNNRINYGDTDSLHIETKYWDVLDKTKLAGKELCPGKSDCKSGSIFYGSFPAPKIKYCLTVNEFGIIHQHMSFKGFNDSKRLLDRSHNFDMLKGEKISAMLPRSWKKSINNVIVIPEKMKRCDERNDKILCMTCNNDVNENKEFEANLNLLKRKAPNLFGHMLPYIKEEAGLFVKARLLYYFLLFISYLLAKFLQSLGLYFSHFFYLNHNMTSISN